VSAVLHITSGDIAGGALAQSGLPGEVFVWHDILYDGPRNPGWPDAATLQDRARFLEDETGGGLSRERVLATLENQYRKLAEAAGSAALVLWFDACLFDQSMLAHVLACLRLKGAQAVALLCVDAYPGVVPYDGLGQLQPGQLAGLYDQRRPVTDAQFRFAEVVDDAFATQDPLRLRDLADTADAPLPWVPAAVSRWLQEQPDPRTGLGRLEELALLAIRRGCGSPAEIFVAVSAGDTHPQYWGDTTLWGKINALADRTPPLVRIEGPARRLPRWEGMGDLRRFTITSLPSVP
jgi:hypothetical protein